MAKPLHPRRQKAQLLSHHGQDKQASRSKSLPTAKRHPPLNFVADQDLMQRLDLIPGAVTPLGLLNDREYKMIFWLDKSFLVGSGLISVHLNNNAVTLWLKTKDLLRILEEDGTQITLFEA